MKKSMGDNRDVGPKSRAFSDLIKPHLDEIRKVCEANGINYMTYFALDQVMPDVILQARRGAVIDKTDRPGSYRVCALWDCILEGEQNYTDRVVEDPERTPN